MMNRALTIVCVILTCAMPARAQTLQITGSVVDESGLGVPGATVHLSGTASRDLTTSGQEGAYRFAGVAPGTYRVTATLVGFSQATSTDVVVAGSDVAVPRLTLKLASLAETVVVSATRNDTPLIDAPSTMTVLRSAELQSSPAQNYGDLLRSVPGLNVIQLSARDVNITSRQATGTLSNTQLVLLDGRSVYLDFFGIVLWDLLPANLDTIKQIEVIRGPASAVWGANALTGVVNIITKSPREAKGAEATFTGGFMSRDAGSTAGQGAGGLFGANASFADAPNATWAYRVSGGYFGSDAFPRPTGRIPVITDPRDTTGRTTVGGATYPIDGTGAFGTAFANRGASQPKFDARVDQELGSRGRLTYEAGVAGTQGVIYTGVGPFDIQSGSTLTFGRVNYSRDALKVNFFVNRLHAEAPNLLFPDAATGQPLQMTLTTKTFDFEAGDAFPIGTRQVLSVGGNIRRNDFDITLAPQAKDRNELGAYIQDEILFDWVRFNIGGRVDKFGNLSDPFFSPRLSANFRILPEHSIRLSYNRAFRSPSVVNNYLEANIVSLQDLRGLAASAGDSRVDGAGRNLPAANGVHLSESRSAAAEGPGVVAGSTRQRQSLGIRQLFVAGHAGHSVGSESLPDLRARLRADEPVQRWLQRRPRPLAWQSVGELLRQGLLERRSHGPVPRLHRLLHDGEWSRRRTLAEREGHDLREGHESFQQGHSAARVRRHPEADGRVRSPRETVALVRAAFARRTQRGRV